MIYFGMSSIHGHHQGSSEGGGIGNFPGKGGPDLRGSYNDLSKNLI
jgi:hypothetical protein